jgi:hypothetical protein
MTEPAERTEAERLRLALHEMLAGRDATIARLQQERDTATHEAEALKVERGGLELSRDAWAAEQRRYAEMLVVRTRERNNIRREAEALREEVERLTKERNTFALWNKRHREQRDIMIDASAQPAPDSASMAPGPLPDPAIWADVIPYITVEEMQARRIAVQPGADDVERARAIWRKWWHPDGTSANMIEDIAAALTAAHARGAIDEKQRQVARVAMLRMRNDDNAPPRNLVEEVTAAFPIEDWADILASALRIDEPEAKNAILRDAGGTTNPLLGLT